MTAFANAMATSSIKIGNLIMILMYQHTSGQVVSKLFTGTRFEYFMALFSKPKPMATKNLVIMYSLIQKDLFIHTQVFAVMLSGSTSKSKKVMKKE